MKSSRINLSCHPLTLPVLAAIALFGLPTANATSYPDTIKADNPVAYYRFEDLTNATTVRDSSASGANPGTLMFDDYGAWPQLGQPGLGSNSIAFHLYTDTFGVAEKSYVSVPYSPDLNPPGSFTTECWARATSWGTENRCFLSSFQNYNAGWWFRQEAGTPTPTTNPRWLYVHNGGGIYMGGGNIAKNVWTHLVVTYDGTTVYFYANGVETWHQAGTIPAPNALGPLCIGGDPAIGNELFDGNVDEVAIYNSALTVDQIKLHYAVGVTNFFVPPVAAYVVAGPVPASAYAGRTATFSLDADGTTPLSYQWYKGTTPIAGATSDILTFTCAYADNGANYKVVVTNLYGSATSTPVALTVMTDLTLESSPASITRNVGSKAAFIAVPGGALPVTYQWYKGATQIPGATDQVLWLSNVKSADDQTTYYAHMTNPWANTNSDPATLTVVPRAVTVPITGYAKVVMADDPVAYWRLDEPDASTTAVDAAGSFDGTYMPGAGSIAYGVATAIPHETNTAMKVTGGATVQIPYALELNSFGPFSVEAWLQPATVAVTEYRSALGSLGSGANGPTGWHLYLQPNQTWALIVWNASWSGTGWFADSDDIIVAQNWYHVVIAYDGTLFKLYVNSVERFGLPYPDFVQNSDSPLVLGWGYSSGPPFDGTIDDVALYNKALTPDQVQAHYNATVKVGITRSGNNVILSWPLGTLQSASSATGTFTSMPSATSPFTNAVSQTPTFYRVKVQ